MKARREGRKGMRKGGWEKPWIRRSKKEKLREGGSPEAWKGRKREGKKPSAPEAGSPAGMKTLTAGTKPAGSALAEAWVSCYLVPRAWMRVAFQGKERRRKRRRE